MRPSLVRNSATIRIISRYQRPEHSLAIGGSRDECIEAWFGVVVSSLGSSLLGPEQAKKISGGHDEDVHKARFNATPRERDLRKLGTAILRALHHGKVLRQRLQLGAEMALQNLVNAKAIWKKAMKANGKVARVFKRTCPEELTPAVCSKYL